MFSRRDASSTDRATTETNPVAPPPLPVTPPPAPAAQQPSTQPAANRSSEESLVAREDTFEGKLKTSRGVRVMGIVTGEIESAQYVHVEEHARVEADITAEEVVIAGEYAGKVTCRQRVEIRATGRVSGHIDTQKLLLHEGGYFDGELHMQKPTPSTTTASTSTTSDGGSEDRPRRTRYVDLSSDSNASREVGATDTNK